MQFDTKKICKTNSLFDWLMKYGIELDKKGFARCPFHNEKTASFRVYKDGTYHCFGCGAHGDVITFVMSMQNISFKEACEILDRDITYSEKRKIYHVKRRQENQKNNRLKSVLNYWNVFDDYLLNEKIIKNFKPSGPDATPNAMFLYALNQRSVLNHKLDLAENSRERNVDMCLI